MENWNNLLPLTRQALLLSYGFWPSEAEDYSHRNWNDLPLDVRRCFEDREAPQTWEACCRASNRLADLVCAMYHPKDEKARATWPTATWAEIIASELGVSIPETE